MVDNKKTSGTCAIDGCGKDAQSRGWCSLHYQRWLRHGSPTSGRALAGEGMEFLRSLLTTVSYECIRWPFATREDGRGTVWFNGRQELAHRAMCRLAHGEPPSDKHVAAHSCGKGHQGCVNPNHLRWATQAENAADMVEHGTRQYGEANPAAHLSADAIAEIRSLRDAGSQRAIATQFGVSKTTVHRIWAGTIWSGSHGN